MRSFLDAFIEELDTALRVAAGPARAPARELPQPAEASAAPEPIGEATVESARLMRVNHTGEIAAQALYRGQAFVAGDAALRTRLLHAAAEEHDHLAWCETRVTELGDRTSLLSPFWYGGSFAIGALAGLAGDGVSLGFLAETEKQVIEHLDGHLDRLPPDDTRSRGIVEQMQRDENAHRDSAVQHGGIELPAPVRAAMRATARVMTTVAYWV
jgi:ubiquinone biosynthesis monooxygenase Coq7